MNDPNQPDLPAQGQFLVYRSKDGKTKIEVRLENDAVWLIQQHMADLFQTTQQNVSLHLQNIYSEGELQRGATHKEFLSVRREGAREVTRLHQLLNLNERAILPNSGKISHEAAHQHAEDEYERFAVCRRAELEAQGEADLLNLLNAEVKKLPRRKRGGKK